MRHSEADGGIWRNREADGGIGRHREAYGEDLSYFIELLTQLKRKISILYLPSGEGLQN
jgi:hypothetical protein